MVRDYELMYIVRPDLDDEGLAGAMQSVKTLVEGQGGEVVRTTPWGKRRLAYEIERMRDGHYVLLHIRLDGARVRQVEQLLHIHDSVFRHLITIWVESKGKDDEDGAAEAGDEDGARPRARTAEEGSGPAAERAGGGDEAADGADDDAVDGSGDEAEDAYPDVEEDE